MACHFSFVGTQQMMVNGDSYTATDLGQDQLPFTQLYTQIYILIWKLKINMI